MLILAREFIITSLRIVAMGEGIVVAAKFAGKLKTVIQIIVISLLFTPLAGATLLGAVTIGDVAIWIMVAITLISGAAYFKNTGKLFAKKEN